MIFRLIIVLFFCSIGAFSQEKYTKHKITKGDNLTTIAKKYGVKPKDIAEANPNAPKILKLNSILLIPNTKPSESPKSPNSNKAVVVKPVDKSPIDAAGLHEVQAKETLWGIAKKYNVSVDDLKKVNPLLETEGLKMGQQINIPSNGVQSSVVSAESKNVKNAVEENQVPAETEVVVEVLPKETKYAIAKRYGITVAELERQNPFVKGKLPVGYMLKIRTSKEKADAAQQEFQTVPQIKENAAPVLAVNDSKIKEDTATVFRVSNHSELVNQLIVNATDNIGIRYRSGGTTKAGFDCSGLMICTFNNFDIKLPRSSIEQSRIGTRINSEEAQKGDLIFFKTNGRRQINHVGMVVEVIEGEIKFVHSSTHGGVMISSTKEPYYERAFTQVNRVVE